MMLSRNTCMMHAVACLSILLAAWVQANAYLNTDTTWLLHAAGMLFEGGTLYVDAMESNPPLVVWLHLIPIWLVNVLSISAMMAMVLCITSLSLIAYVALTRITSDTPLYPVLFALAVSLLAPNSYAEREHLLILLATPYLTYLFCDQKPHSLAAIAAAVGFMLKPFFLLIWAVALTVRLCKDRSFCLLFHRSTGIILIAGTVYAGYLLMVDTTYITHILPLLIDYYHGFDAHRGELTRPILWLACLGLAGPLLFLYYHASDKHKHVILAVTACAMAALITLIIQSKGWNNHWYPYLAFAFIANGMIASVLFTDHSLSGTRLVIPSIALLCIIVLSIMAGTSYVRLWEKGWPENAHDMVQFLQKDTTSKTVAALTFDLATAFPAIAYTEKDYVFSYGHLWPLPGMYQLRPKNDNHEAIYHSPEAMNAAESALFHETITELITTSPDILLINKRDNYLYHDGSTYGFDFIAYFSQDASFAEWWTGYEQIHRIGDVAIYQKP